MTVAQPVRLLLLGFALGTSTFALSQAKIDADDSDVVALQQKVRAARTEKLPPIRNERGNPLYKACKSGKLLNNDPDLYAAYTCGNLGAMVKGEVGEHLMLRGCSFVPNGRYSACVELARFYVKEGRMIEALAALRLPNASSGDRKEDMYAAQIQLLIRP
jgi:hypothetical protein